LSTSASTSERKIPGWAAGWLIWLVLRCITSLWAALVSGIRPVQPLENAIPLWPPSLPIGDWLDRVFISPLLRWDAAWYLRILTQGYRPEDGTSSFHPLYPLLARPFLILGTDAAFSLVLVAALAGLGLVFFWDRLAGLDLDEADRRMSMLLFLFFPMSFILFVPYTEALFLFLSVACVYWTRRRCWIWAGVAGGLAVLTRQQGFFLWVIIAWEIWEVTGKNWRRAITYYRGWLSASLIPLGMIAWLVYRGIVLSDVSVDWQAPSSFITSFLISASHAQVVPVFQFMWPWQALGIAIQKLWAVPDVDLWTNLFFGGVLLILLILSWKKISKGYRLYSLAILLAAFSYHTGAAHPYMGLVRHIWLAFPLFIGLAPRVRSPGVRLVYVGLGLIGMLFLLLQYGLESWVP
jgi:hypothetical protein